MVLLFCHLDISLAAQQPPQLPYAPDTRDTDLTIREGVQPRFWETIRHDLVDVF